MKRLARWMLVILFLTVHALYAQDTPCYYVYQDLPDASVYLPAPPAFDSPVFAGDMEQWRWGKSMRHTERGAMASKDSDYGFGCMSRIYGEVLGITISKEATPAIWNFMVKVGETGHSAVWSAKVYYMRTRPFALMNEPTFGEYDDADDLRHNGSYPSGHTALGWTTALAFAEMVPEMQDAILHRGYEYGQSRVIVGAHWQSDVDAARVAVSSAFAMMHNHPDYQKDLQAAREEYLRVSKTKARTTGYPDALLIMGPPIDTNSRRYYGDFIQYWQAKAERHSPRGVQAIIDADDSETALLSCFAPSMGLNLSPKETPHIAELMAYSRQIFLDESARLKATGFRKRPYVQFGEPSLIPSDEEANRLTSSYPSASATLGWGLALVLVELNPERQDFLLTRGYEYGRSRVIAGYHYASDVHAGRVLAGMVFARMQADPEFQRLMGEAKKEIKDKK